MCFPVESALSRALFSCAATNASADLAETGLFQSIYLPPPEQLLDIRQLEFDIGRAAVIALTGKRRRFHLA